MEDLVNGFENKNGLVRDGLLLLRINPSEIIKERILVLGAGGWFGRTFTEMVGPDAKLFQVGSYSRNSIRIWDLDEIKKFDPTIVVSFAFLTRNKLPTMPRSKFIQTNNSLIKNLKDAAILPSVHSVMTVSSGAALHRNSKKGADSEEIYGALKREEELAMKVITKEGKRALVLRAFSVSGPFVRNPLEYAFSSFVVSALKDKVVKVNADHRVFRRYVSVSDYLYVGFRSLKIASTEVIESGGEIIELGQLAELVAQRLGVGLERQALNSKSPDDYYASDCKEWLSHSSQAGLVPLDINDQIESVIRYFSINSAAWRRK